MLIFYSLSNSRCEKTCGAWFVTAAEGAVLRLRPSGSYPTGCSMLHTASCMSVQLGLLLSHMLLWLLSPKQKPCFW